MADSNKQMSVDEIIAACASIDWSRPASEEDYRTGAANSAAAFQALKSWYLDTTRPLIYSDDESEKRLTFGFDITIGGLSIPLPAMYDSDEEWYDIVMDFISAMQRYYEDRNN